MDYSGCEMHIHIYFKNCLLIIYTYILFSTNILVLRMAIVNESIKNNVISVAPNLNFYLMYFLFVPFKIISPYLTCYLLINLNFSINYRF